MRGILTFMSIVALTAAAAPDAEAQSGSPEIHPDGKVTFRIRAPRASEVKVAGQFGKEQTLAKGERDVWSVTTEGPVAPGVYEYSFIVDGMRVLDQMNPAIKPQRQPGASILHIPANPPAPWDLQDVPHGAVSELTYHSKALDKWRRVVVYTPPGYRADGEPLPVLYLSHGFGDNEQTWTAHGKAHWILDNLIAEKKAAPMLIVMPDAHALPPGPGYRDDYATQNTAAFCKELLEDVKPLVESTFNVKKEPAARAFAGLSMGGHHAITVALAHGDQFGWIGAFSAAPPQLPAIQAGLDNAEKTNANLKLFWIACGKADFLFERNQQFDKLLKEKGINHQYEVTEGDHSWPIWRQYLTEFAPKIFK